MKLLIIATAAVASFAGIAHAGASDLQYLEAARCRGLAASENLGKLDTAAVDNFLRTESDTRSPEIKTSAMKKMSSAEKDAAGAAGEKKAKLLAERESSCGAYLGGAK
ncbi:hypothetical protein [Caulobacter sp. 1776]|uniref:hypothetical protein n=1 Tax=Caulobacter sp. 1776 TaxID=3156420 RepID=UPI003398CEF0